MRPLTLTAAVFVSLNLGYSASYALAAGTIFGTVSQFGGGSPAVDTVQYRAYVHNGGDLEQYLLTEDSFNADQGENKGYTGTFYLVNFGNNPNAVDGEKYYLEVLSESLGEYATAGFDTDYFVPAGTVGGPAISMDPVTMPDAVTDLSSSQTGTSAVLDWTAESGVTYWVYRGVYPCCVDENDPRSNGFYERRAQGVTPPWTDAPASEGEVYWYLVVPEDGLGQKGPHSADLRVEIGPQVPTPTTTSTNTPTAEPTDTPTATPTDTPTALPTDTPTTLPTDTPEPEDTPTPVNTPTPTPPPDVPAFSAGGVLGLALGMGALLRRRRRVTQN